MKKNILRFFGPLLTTAAFIALNQKPNHSSKPSKEIAEDVSEDTNLGVFFKIVKVALSGQMMADYKYQSNERQHIANINPSTIVHSVNQHCDSVGVRLDKPAYQMLLKSVGIEQFAASNFQERNHKNLKNIKTEVKLSCAFEMSALKTEIQQLESELDLYQFEPTYTKSMQQKQLTYDRVGSVVHKMLGIAWSTVLPQTVFGDELSNSLSASTNLEIYLQASKQLTLLENLHVALQKYRDFLKDNMHNFKDEKTQQKAYALRIEIFHLLETDPSSLIEDDEMPASLNYKP